ncbi:MAG: cell division protein ZapA [Novosphingobium sp.]|uniref:cell division protein ZapA n=1 Tax=Novosphingobium sp. TaxID=1874826 RepID=UPI0032BD75D3
MSNVNLSIGGRSYLVACAAGEEARVAELGEAIEGKVREIGASSHNEVRLLLFAALLLADENHELKSKGGAAIAHPSTEFSTGPSAAALDALADRLEKCASALEG